MWTKLEILERITMLVDTKWITYEGYILRVRINMRVIQATKGVRSKTTFVTFQPFRGPVERKIHGQYTLFLASATWHYS